MDVLFTLFGLVVVFYLAPRAVVRGYRRGRRERD